MIEGQLFHEEKKGQLILVVQRHQVAAILYMVHDHPTGGYRGPGSMSQKIRQMYYWKTIFEDCKRHVQMCRACQFQGKLKKNNELHPIPIGEPWEQIGIDIMRPLLVTERGNKYIVTCIDYSRRKK